MSTHPLGKTVGEIQAALGIAFGRLSETPLPPELVALKDLVPPPGMSVRVSLRDPKKNRQTRRDADSSYWNLNTHEAVIRFERDNAQDKAAADASTPQAPLPNPLEDLVRVLEAAERDARFREFVGIKVFRDQYLATHGGAWAADVERRRAVLGEAIDRGLVLRSSVPNPKTPSFPTTSIRVNREHSETKKLLSAAAAERASFRPITIRGESLSSTVLSERR